MTGYQKHQAQQRWLKAQRIPFLIGGDGMPRVMRATVMGILAPAPRPNQSGPQLRWRIHEAPQSRPPPASLRHHKHGACPGTLKRNGNAWRTNLPEALQTYALLMADARHRHGRPDRQGAGTHGQRPRATTPSKQYRIAANNKLKQILVEFSPGRCAPSASPPSRPGWPPRLYGQPHPVVSAQRVSVRRPNGRSSKTTLHRHQAPPRIARATATSPCGIRRSPRHAVTGWCRSSTCATHCAAHQRRANHPPPATSALTASRFQQQKTGNKLLLVRMTPTSSRQSPTQKAHQDQKPRCQHLPVLRPRRQGPRIPHHYATNGTKPAPQPAWQTPTCTTCAQRV